MAERTIDTLKDEAVRQLYNLFPKVKEEYKNNGIDNPVDVATTCFFSLEVEKDRAEAIIKNNVKLEDILKISKEKEFENILEMYNHFIDETLSYEIDKTIYEMEKQSKEFDYLDESDKTMLGVAGLLINNDYELSREDLKYKLDLIEYNLCLDKFINDENWEVRLAVAKQKYGLDRLVHDENELVRAAVAYQNYGLDILENDKSEHVRNAVKMMRNLQKEKNNKIRISKKSIENKGNER